MNGNVKAFRKSYIPCNHNIFGSAQRTFKPRNRGIISLVHNSSVDKTAVFAMAKAFQPEIGSVFHCKTHNVRVFNRLSVVAERNHADGLHFTYFRKTFALLTLGNSAYRVNFTQIHFVCAMFYISCQNSVIANGVCIGHTANLRYAACDSSLRAAFYIFFTLETRLSQMNVHIYYAGKNMFAACVDSFAFFFDFRRNFHYFFVFNK